MNWVYMPPIDMEWDVESKVRSKDNLNHVPSGGNKCIQSHPVKWKAESKVDSLDEKHMAQVEKSLLAPKKDHVRRIKIPPTIPVSNFKKVEYTRNGVYAIVEPPVKIKAKSKINFPKKFTEDARSLRPFDNDVNRRIKVTKNTKIDKYTNVEETEFGTYIILDPVKKIEAKSKVDFPKSAPVTERRHAETVDITRRIKVTRNTKIDNYNNIEHTNEGTYVLVDPVKIEAKSKIDFRKSDPVSDRKPSEHVDVTRRIKVTKNTRVDKYKHVEQTDDGTYVVVDPVKIEAKSKVDFPKPGPASERMESDNIDVFRRIKVTKNTRIDNYKHVVQKKDGIYVVVDPVKIEAKSKVDFPKPDPTKEQSRKQKEDNLEHKFRFF